MNKDMILRNWFLSLNLAMALLAQSAIAAQPAAPKAGFDEKAVADFYRNKTVRIVVGFSAGGGYDQYSRLIARHLSKFIPGNPNVLVDNMAGAGSIIAANHTFNAAPKDGTVIGNISGPIILEQLFGNPAIQFDMASTPNDFGKVYVVPPGTPADRATALEKAFEKVFTDKELQVDAVKGKLEIDPTIGEDIHKLVVEFLGMSPDLKNKLQTALKGEKK
jgi:tripartite-type tricarboxylate transporter receptor subunit TctC